MCGVLSARQQVSPGDLIHADKHGFLAIPKEDQSRIYEASCFMDANECETLIAAARSSAGKSSDEVVQALNEVRFLIRADLAIGICLLFLLKRRWVVGWVGGE
jgi:regulator of RNase E activity RraA